MTMTEQNALAARARLLVVDDSRIVRATIRKHLTDEYDIVEEADGEAAWQRLLADETIRLLITDLSMPELDGMGLLARIRSSSQEQVRQLPVIVISGEEDEAIKHRCVQAGANDFITKSTDRVEMRTRVKASLDLAATRRERDESRQIQAQTATVDAVTGVGTQHLLTLQLQQLLAHAQRHSRDVTLMLIEIDHFPPLAAKLGERLAGQMLNLLAKLVSARLRQEDTFARLDGALFAVVSQGSTLAGAQVQAERLRHAIGHARVNFREEQLQVTASLALASSHSDQADSPQTLLTAALARLRAAPGENRLLVPEAIPQPAPVPTPAPQLAEALTLLQQGKANEIRPHLPALLANLLPLLELANVEMGLGWSLEKLRGREK
ncbi:MAG: hypothetical protein H6R07_1057 [Proteobacteria bacterium]|nr:hypothetical protein [Pseudomonadota bacterium]